MVITHVATNPRKIATRKTSAGWSTEAWIFCFAVMIARHQQVVRHCRSALNTPYSIDEFDSGHLYKMPCVHYIDIIILFVGLKFESHRIPSS